MEGESISFFPFFILFRIAALLGLVLLFLALVTVAVLIIVLDGECATDDAVQESIALPSNGTTATPQMEYTGRNTLERRGCSEQS